MTGVFAYGGGSATAQQSLPVTVQKVLLEAAAEGDQALLEAVEKAVEENPELADAIVEQATQLRPAPEKENGILAATLPDEMQMAAAEESRSPSTGAVIAGVAGLAVAGGAVALATGGGGGGGGGEPAPEPDPAPGPDPDPDPDPGPSPPDFETFEYKAQEGLALVKASDAYARGASGQGVVIAVLDSGLDVSHSEFQGNVAPGGYDFILNTPVMSDPNGHGTHVSGIAAARKDDTGMHGVAYGASVLPIRLFDASGFTPLTDAQFASAIDRAVANGAMVLNNSWGSSLPVTSVTRDEILAAIPAETNAWGRAVANDAVVVFATGNDFSSQPTVRPGLPYHFPEHQGLWLAVMAVELDGDKPAYSNACGVAAAWCLAAPGGGATTENPGVFSTLPIAQGSYGRASGTSMAAPHVSGAVAVLMELFPELTHGQIVARLLETADKSGVYGNPSIFGQGLLDLEAATRPVGEVVILTGDSTATTAHSLSSTRVDLGPAFGDGLKRSLSGAKLAVFDKQRATFVIDLDAFVRSGGGATDVGALLERFQTAPRRLEVGESSFFSLRFSDAPAETGTEGRERTRSRLQEFSFTSLSDNAEATFSYNRHPALNFGLHRSADIDRSLVMSDDAFLPPYLSFAGEGFNMAVGANLAELGTLKIGSFVGREDGGGQSNDAFGSMAEAAMPLADRAEISVQLGVVSEQDTMLGSQTAGAFDISDTTTYFGGLTGKLELTESLLVVGSYFTGLSDPSLADSSLFSDISSIRTDAFSIGLIGHDAFSEGDRAGFVINQPLRVTDGEASLIHATGRAQDGALLKQETRADLTPSGRELDFEGFYETALGEQSTLGASFMLRTEPGHVANADEEAVFLIKFSHKF